MPLRTFTVFQDHDPSLTATSASSSMSNHAQDTPSTATKENINPLTGLTFDIQPPLKRRKPSSSVLKVKPLPKISSKSKRIPSMSLTTAGRDKGKRKTGLGMMGTRNIANLVPANDAGTTEADELCAALGNRNAYNLTVMPLADVTQAYDESFLVGTALRAEKCAMEDQVDLMVKSRSEENDVNMDITISEEPQISVYTTVA